MFFDYLLNEGNSQGLIRASLTKRIRVYSLSVEDCRLQADRAPFIRREDMTELEGAKLELEKYEDIFDSIWDEEITEEDELIYMKFFKAGVEVGRKYDR